MRIIAGRNRGKKLLLPNFDGTRPTADLVKTSMFGLLDSYIDGARVLDLFAGSGALGLECLSRYAESAVFVDMNPQSCDLVQKNAQSMKYSPEIINLPYDKALLNFKRRGQKFDIILLDPPYHKGLESQALLKIIDFEILTPNGICVVEMAKEDSMDEQVYEFFEELKNRTFGIKRILLLQRKNVKE